MKTLEALCLAYNWQGGTLDQAVRNLPNRIDQIFMPVWLWGLREGKTGRDLAGLSVPINSWKPEDHYQMITSFVLGFLHGEKELLEQSANQ